MAAISPEGEIHIELQVEPTPEEHHPAVRYTGSIGCRRGRFAWPWPPDAAVLGMPGKRTIRGMDTPQASTSTRPSILSLLPIDRGSRASPRPLAIHSLYDDPASGAVHSQHNLGSEYCLPGRIIGHEEVVGLLAQDLPRGTSHSSSSSTESGESGRRGRSLREAGDAAVFQAEEEPPASRRRAVEDRR